MLKYFGLLVAFLLFQKSLYADSSGTQQIVIGVASFATETCTFCPRRTTEEHFDHYGKPITGIDVFNYPRPGLTGFAHRIRQYPDVKLEGVYSTHWPLGGTMGSWISHRAFDRYTGELVQHLSELPQLDGIYLPLHGGMAVEGIPRPEAEIIKRIREQLGDVPIAVTLDLHANEDKKLIELADIVLAVKRYPHYDFNLMGSRAAELLVRTIKGDYRPTAEIEKPGIVFASIYGATHEGFPQDVMERARRWENQHLDTYVSVLWGFSYADVVDAGVSVIALTNNRPDLARRIVRDMNSFIWHNRDKFEYHLPSSTEVITTARSAVDSGTGPVVIADHADRLGDSTHILHALSEAKAENVALATIADPMVVSKISENHQIGDLVTVKIGGKSSPLAGEPFSIEGMVTFIGKLEINHSGIRDTVVVLKHGFNNWIVITPHRYQARTAEIFFTSGVPVDTIDIFVVKSRVHFRRGFIETGLARKAYIFDAPGHGPADIGTLKYKNHPTGLYSKYFRGDAE